MSHPSNSSSTILSLKSKILVIFDLWRENSNETFWHCQTLWNVDLRFFLEFEIATRGEIKSCIRLQRYDRENDQMVKNCNFFVSNVNLTFILSIFSSFIFFNLYCMTYKIDLLGTFFYGVKIFDCHQNSHHANIIHLPGIQITFWWSRLTGSSSLKNWYKTDDDQTKNNSS